MTTTEALRAYVAAHGLAPRDDGDHLADYTRQLGALDCSTATHAIRDSRGRRWLVTKLSTGAYVMSGPRYAEARSAGEAARVMEGE